VPARRRERTVAVKTAFQAARIPVACRPHKAPGNNDTKRVLLSFPSSTTLQEAILHAFTRVRPPQRARSNAFRFRKAANARTRSRLFPERSRHRAQASSSAEETRHVFPPVACATAPLRLCCQRTEQAPPRRESARAIALHKERIESAIRARRYRLLFLFHGAACYQRPLKHPFTTASGEQLFAYVTYQATQRLPILCREAPAFRSAGRGSELPTAVAQRATRQ